MKNNNIRLSVTIVTYIVFFPYFNNAQDLPRNNIDQFLTFSQGVLHLNFNQKESNAFKDKPAEFFDKLIPYIKTPEIIGTLFIQNSRGNATAWLLNNISQFTSLEQLHITHCNLEDTDIAILADALPHLTQLQMINLKHNAITEACAPYLGRCFAQLQNLKVVFLEKNAIKTEAEEIFFNAIVNKTGSIVDLDRGTVSEALLADDFITIRFRQNKFYYLPHALKKRSKITKIIKNFRRNTR